MKDEIIFSPFYSSFLSLCKRDGISPTEAAKRASISSGAPTAWKKKGAVPRQEQLKKLCALFNVSENELLGYSAQKEQPALVPESRPLYPPEYDLLSPEDRAIVDNMIRSLAKKKSSD